MKSVEEIVKTHNKSSEYIELNVSRVMGALRREGYKKPRAALLHYEDFEGVVTRLRAKVETSEPDESGWEQPYVMLMGAHGMVRVESRNGVARGGIELEFEDEESGKPHATPGYQRG